MTVKPKISAIKTDVYQCPNSFTGMLQNQIYFKLSYAHC